MERLTFKTTIDAPREKVWSVLWNETTYREWASVFAPGSDFQGDWQEGSKILFVDGSVSGMVSRIARRRENEFMSIEHLGEVHDGVEDITSDKVKQWAGAHENYTLKDVDGKTELIVETDMTEDFKDYFVKTWPKALEKLKGIAEGKREPVR